MASNRKLLLLCAFIVGAVAVPVPKREQCARYCTEEGEFSLRPGSTYTYDYETTTTTAVQGSSQDKTQMQLTAQVDIEVLSRCDLSLRLRGVTLKVSDPESPDYLNTIRGARDFARSVERNILRFSFQNGKVEHVCPTDEVPVWVTNIQKGVLSAFQTYMLQPDWSTKVIETDVLGKCTAEYQSLGLSWQGTHTIRKLKDLSTCTDRENIQTYLQGTPYAQNFQTKSLPLVKGNQECEQVLGQGYLQSSTCREKLVFRPFSNGGSSVVTNVVQKLSYATVSQRTFTGNDYRPTTELLLFRHAAPEENPSKKEEDAESALKELCSASQKDVSITVPRIFSSFVYKLKKLNLGSLRSFYQKVENICPSNNKARKFFMDAIPIVATTDSAKFMYDMISRKEISDTESDFWLTSLSFVNEPTADIIAAFTPLLDGTQEQALLGVTALIHTFCKSNDCSKVPEVQRAVQKLFTNLGENCFNSNDKKVIMTLKALSNVGIMFGKENILQACYNNPQIRMEARLAAIQAFRRVTCDVSRQDLMQMYSNYNEDPEIRIASYLAVMTCPSAEIVDSVKDVLMQEKINHVGSFIWTHLNALSKTKHPHRQDIRDIVSNLYLLNKYNSDARKFSTAREAHFYLESLDSGFHVDSHLIFSTDSYLPRTAMFNLTVDVFGKTCNLFQIDGRMEGLEHVVESFFGPSGYFPQKNIAKMLREKRSISNNKIQDMDNKAKSRFQQKPYGSLDVKIFGTTLWYDQFQETDDGRPDINLLEFVTKLAEEHEVEYSRSFMFMDTTFVVPMTSGMPLSIAVNGTASVGIKYGGKFDVKGYENVHLLGHIEPSGAIEIASLLTVDAGNAARSGLRVVGTMHSSTVLDGRVEVRNGEVVKAQLNMPRDRIDIFNVQSKMYLVHGPEEREQKVDRKGETNFKSCSGETAKKLFGVQLCSELRLPPYKPNSALHPINGPAHFKVYIQKTDPTLKSYTFESEWKLEKKNGALIRHGQLSMNTPDSQIDRDVKMELNINHADHTATFNLKTPVKRFGAIAKLTNEEALKKLQMQLTMDDKDYFSLQTELKTVLDKSSVTFMPSLEIRIPSRRVVAVSGSAYIKRGQKYTAQLQIEDLTEKPILAKGNLEVGKKDRYEGELNINSFVIDGTVKGYAQLGDSMASRITAEYKFLEGKMNKINIMGKMRNLSANALVKYSGLLNIQASLLPEWTTELAFETMTTTGHIENTVSLSLGDGVRSRVHTIRLQKILRYEGNLKNNKVDAILNLAYPEKNINYGIQINHENTENSLKNTMKVQYDTNQNVVTEVQLNVNKNTPFSVAGGVKLRYPGRDAAVSVNLSETSPKEYTGSMTCQWREGRQASFIVNYRDKTDSTRMKYELEGEMSLPLRTPITFTSTVGSQQGQFAGFAEVNMGMDKYRVKLDYSKGNGLNHRASGQVILNNQIYGLEAALQQAKSKLSCNVEVKMPNRQRITAKLEGRTGEFIRVGTFETLWDADRDTSKRFGINGELRTHPDGYESKVIVQIRRRTVTGLMSTSMKGEFLSSSWNTNNKIELEWSPSEKATAVISSNILLDRTRQQVSSQLEITTPFYNYENFSLSLTHMYANQQWESELSTILPQKNQIFLSTSGKYSIVRGGATVETKTKLQTSFAYLREIDFDLSHDHNSKELTSKVQAKWGSGKRVALDVSGVTQPSVYRGSLKFTSPFKNLEDLSAEIVHNYVTDNYRTRCELQWAPRRKVAVNFEGKHVLNGRRRICTIALSGSSPFQDFENPSAKITYSNDGNAVNTDVELNWSDRKKISTSFTGSVRNSPYVKNIESKFLVTTPFRNYENFQISTSLETNRNSYKVNVDAQLPHRSTASLNSQGKITSLNDIELNAVVIGHFPRYMQPQRASIDFVHTVQSSKLRTSLDTAYNNNRLNFLAIGLVESGYNSRNIEFSASTNSPFKGYEEIKFDFSHEQKANEWLTKVQSSKNKISGSLTHKLAIQDMLNFETTIEATSSEFTDAKVSIIQVHNKGQLEHNSYVTWDRKRINFNAQYLDRSSTKEFSLKLTTLIRKVWEFEVKSSYEHQNWDHKASLSVVMDRRHKAALSGNIRNYRWKNVDAKFEMTSSYAGYEVYSGSFNYDLTAPQKSLEMSYLWDINSRKAITLKSNLLHSYTLTNMEVEVTTPYQDFKQITFSTKFENSSPETSLDILYERDSRRIIFNGKTVVQNHRAQVNFDISTPYKQIRSLKWLAKYDRLNEGMTGEITADWNAVSKYQLKGEYKLKNKAAEGRLAFLTPFEGFRNVDIQSNINYGGSRKVGELSVKWENDNMVLVNSEFITRRDGHGVNINIQTSFDNYEDVSFNSWYKAMSESYEGEIKAVMGKNNVYESNGALTFGGEHFMDLKFNINLPASQLRNLKLTASIDSESGFQQITSVLLLNGKESNLKAFFKRDRTQFFEVDVKLETPYETIRHFNLESTLRRQNYQFIDARLKIITPFELLKTLDAYSEIRVDDSGCQVSFSFSTPQQKIKLEGQVSNRQFRPFTAVFEIDAPFLSFKKISTSADINLVSWNNAKMSFKVSSTRFNHELITVFLKDDDDLEFQIKTESSSLKSREAIFTVKANYDNMNNIDTETSLQMLGNVHYLKGQFTNTARSMEILAKFESPLLPERKAEILTTISRRRRSNTKMYEGKLSFTIPSSTHEINMKYEGKDSQIVSSMKIDSSFLNSSPIEAQAKYTNGNNRDLEASFTVSSSEGSHTVVGSLKNYENEKFLQLKVECPMVEFLNAFSVTGTLKHNNFETMDGSLSIGTGRKELRIAGNMKNEGWKNVEAFVTLNTPFNALPMLRVDGRFRNDRFQNIDCNFQVETSNRNLHSLGMTSKISRTKGSEEISLMLHLPLRNYNTVQILANAHYEADFSSADSRVTLTLASDRYSISGQYGINQPRMSATSELEINGKKWIVAGRLERTTEKNDATFSYTTPSSDKYNFGAAYGKSGRNQFVSGSYINPSNEKYDVNTSLSFVDYKNFETAVRVETPFSSYRNIEVTINQQHNSNYLSTNMEYLANGRRGFLKILHRVSRNLVTGSVQMGCPYAKLRDVKLAYNHQKKPRDQECSLELDWNKVKQFKAELLQFGDKSAHVILDVPVLPMTLTADSKVQSNGREMNFKTQYNSRVVGFRTSFIRELREISHDASFTWDEKADKRISYDFKLTDTATGKELWSRLDMPVRSFMLKGNFTNSNKARSGGFDFYWDASRSLEKHMAIGLEHTDMSSARQTYHRVQIKAEHPKLSRDIIQTNVIAFGPNEFHIKSELVYSRQRHHHLLMEMRANVLSRSNRDSHYKGEFTLRHPVTKLDVRANGEVMNSKLESSLSFKINTVDKNQVQHIQDVKASLSKIMQEIDITMRSDENVKKILGSVTSKNGEMVIFIEVKKNEVKEFSTLLKVNNRNKSSEFTVMNAENTGVHASASYSKESATLKLSHSNKGNAITDLNVFVGLEQSRLLKSQLNWRPRMWEELRITTGENLRAFIRHARSTYTSVSQEVSEELGERTSLMSRYAYEQMISFADEISSDVAEMKRDFEIIRRSFQRMYRNNEFYMQDIVRSYDNWCKYAREVMDGLSLGFEVLGNIITEYCDDLYYSAYYGYIDLTEYLEKEYAKAMQSLSLSMTKMQRSIAKYSQIYSKKLHRSMAIVWRKVQSLTSGITVTFEKWVRAYAPIFIDGYFYLKNAADTVRETIYDFYDAVYERLESNKYYSALKNYAASILETFQKFRDYEYTETAQEFFNQIYDAQVIDSIINHPNVEYMSDLANTALLKSVQIYHNLGLDMAVASISESITKYAKEVALNTVQELLSDMYQLKGGAKYEFAPHRGYMAFEMSLPAPRNSLIEVFDFKSYPEYQKIIDLKTTLSEEYYEDFCIWDYYYTFLKYFSPGYWLPTFTGHAIISGNQHYITFDKMSYDYAGKCSYLLARDFVDGNFSVIINYGDDHIRKSLTVLSEGKKIDIGHDYRITVDDIKTESPVQIGPTVVMREGANIRIENDKKGFYIVCNFVYNFCSVSLSGFYYAKTGGLFGTFNYEPKLDMMTPTRHMANDLESFASSWEVGQGTCRSTENLATVPGNDYRVHEKCKNLFSKTSSEFRACFKQVDPQPYLMMCISDLSAVHHRNFDEAICDSAAAYFLQCKTDGVPLKMPSKCVRCEKQDGSMMTEGEALKFTRDDVITAADVVFLIEEKECNKDRVKYLGKLAQSIEENYRHSGYRDVRFSVVGFGGSQIHSAPHVHTMDGQVSGPLRSLQSALESLQFGDGPNNILEALRYAASLNFRPGTTKSFVLMKCSTCKSEEVKAEYSEMLRTLIDGDISLHLLMEQRYEMKIPNKNAKARKVIGVDKTFAYTLKDVKDSTLSGDGDLLAQLRLPKDVCIPLAFELNGSTFDVQFLFDTRKNTNKKFIDVMSRRVVRSASRTSPQWGMCCECIATVDGVGRSTCQKCVSAEIANMISAETSGVNMIPISPETDVSKRRVRKHKDRKNKE